MSREKFRAYSPRDKKMYFSHIKDPNEGRGHAIISWVPGYSFIWHPTGGVKLFTPVKQVIEANGIIHTSYPEKVVSDAIFMDYIGLKDKNDKEIYEGDVVRFHYFFNNCGPELGVYEDEHELTGVFSWGTYGWSVEKIKGEHWRGYTGYDDGQGSSNVMELLSMNESSIHEESFEVIGNIYEHNHLIEKQ